MKTTTGGIPHLRRKTWDILSIISGSTGRGFEEQRKRSVLVLFLMLGVSIAYPFAIHHLILGNVIRATLLFIVGSVQLSSIVALHYVKRGNLVFRVNVILLGSYFLFLIIMGGTHGSRILWSFVFPLFSFFLFGKKEGLFWSALFFFLSIIIFISPFPSYGLYPYPEEVKIRFLITYAIIVLMSYIVESTRQRYQDDMEQAHLELEERVRQRTTELRNANEKLKSEIRDRILAEETLKAAEQEKALILSSLMEHVIYEDRSLKILWANRAACESAGMSQKQIIGRHCYEIWRQRKNPCSDCPVKWAIETGQHREVEKTTAEGRTWLVRGYPVRDAHDNIVGGIEVTLEITDRVQAQDALKESEERFRILVEKSPLGVSLMGRDGRYRYLNPKFVEIFGYAPQEIPTGREWMEKAYPDPAIREDVINTWKQDVQALKAGELRHRSYKVTCKDGSEKYISFRSVKLETGDVLVIYEDTTEQRRLGTQLLRAQKMEAIGTLAAGIAHDFNNLLMGIQGRASLIQVDMNASDPCFENIRAIEDYVQSAADLTKQLLGFARGGKYEVHAADLNKLVDRSAELFGRTKKEITIHKKFHPDLWAVEVDRRQMGQVLLNLFVNAWQAMPNGGEIFLQTQNVALDEDYVKPYGLKSGNYVKMSVTDTGIGMDEETKQRVFDPFFTTKGMGRGTGLGLASAYGIIKNHDGIITVHSEKGRGSTFDIYLPASDRAMPVETETPEDLLRGEGTILLVDDEKVILEVGAPLLQKLGYEVLIARSGREALDVYQVNTDRIKMVILDMVMPQMSGGETFDRLKGINLEVKVLLSSGYSLDGQAQEILNRGCAGFIQKPFNLIDLSQKLREVLGLR